MKRVFHKLSFVMFLIVIAFAAGASAGEWRRVTSANFEVTGDAPEADLVKTARRLEQFRAAVTGLFPGMKFNSPAPTVVVVYATRAGYARVKSVDWSIGLFQGGESINYIALSADREERDFFSTVHHEYTHFLTDNTLGRSNVPPWLSEGLAEYYERTEFAGDSTKLGGVNSAHLALLRREGLLPAATLFGTDYYSLQKQTKETAQRFYAQSWLLVHYLIHGGGSTRLTEVVDRLRSGANQKTALGMTDDVAISEIAKYLRRVNFATTTGARSPIATEELRAEVMSPAAALAVEGDLLARLGRLDAAELDLREALALDASEPLANTSLGLLLVKREKFFEARTFLERAVKSAPNDYRPYFALAFALSRTGMTEFGFVVRYTPDDAAAIYANALRAIELKPGFAESYNLFALVCVVRAERIGEGLEMIERALAIAPGNQWYQLRRAELLTRREEFAEARAIAVRVGEDRVDRRAQGFTRTIQSERSTRSLPRKTPSSPSAKPNQTRSQTRRSATRKSPAGVNVRCSNRLIRLCDRRAPAKNDSSVASCRSIASAAASSSKSATKKEWQNIAHRRSKASGSSVLRRISSIAALDAARVRVRISRS